MTAGGGWGPPPQQNPGPPAPQGGGQQWPPAPYQPPPSPQPGPPSRDARGRRWLWLAIAVIVIVVVTAGGAGIALIASRGGPDRGGGQHQKGSGNAGALLWQTTLDAGSAEIPLGGTWVTFGALVYLGADQVTALDPTSGRRIWQVAMPGTTATSGTGRLCGFSSNVAQGLGVIVVGGTQTCTTVVAVDLASGAVKWRIDLPSSVVTGIDWTAQLDLAIVGSTVVFPTIDGLFVCNLSDGGGANVLDAGLISLHTDLLVDPAGDSATLAAWGVLSGQIVFSGTGDLQLWQIRPDGSNVTVQLAAKVPAAAVPMGSNSDMITLGLLAASPMVLESSDLPNGGPAGFQVKRDLFTVASSGSITTLPLTIPSGELDVDPATAISTGSAIFTIGQRYDSGGNPTSVRQVGYSTMPGRQRWANPITHDAQTRPIGLRGQDVIYATGKQSLGDQSGRFTISSINQRTGAVDHQESNYPAGFVARITALEADDNSMFALQGQNVLGVSMLASSGSGSDHQALVYALR
ncbi:MAG TPA: PQQ-binding-like beta-propeller repeat protein [Candidatus Dormibacteraeota bacterium]|nr:PQQ-binding-like beta-propeller repeat protein [Candidatus Dormibacteraeota bacterium]